MVRRGVAVATVVLSFVLVYVARADRSSENMDPAWMYEKAGKYDKAALYYHRALLGLREIYIAFHWNGDPSANATGNATEYNQIPIEMEQRYKKCLSQANPEPDQIKRMEYINYLWMSEMVDQEEGGQRTACASIAAEAERHGDFTLAEILRRGEARFCRVVAIPFHEKSASEFEKPECKDISALHRQAVKDYEQRAERADILARGNKTLMGIRGLEGPERYTGIALYPAKVNPVAFQYRPKRLFSKDGQWKGPSPQQVAAILKKEGLKHADDSVRFSTVNVLANLGQKEAVLSALDDPSDNVRLVAAKSLAAILWADGWAACYRHADADVRAVVAPLLQSAGKDALAHAFVITELIRRLNYSSIETRSFCQTALERIAGKNMQANEWLDWWKSLGNAQPGLTRTGPGVPLEVDETIDFGAWWQSMVHAPNPLVKYQPPATIRWDGYLVVTQPDQYRLYARNCGEGRSSRNRVTTAGRVGFPGLYLSNSSVKLMVDGNIVLPHPSDAVQDPTGGVRLDFSEPIRLDEGLHKIHLEFEYRSKRTGRPLWCPQPCVRLYWSSDHFLRELVPAHHLVTMN